MDFTPLQDFTDDDLRSCYCVGLNYTVRPGNAVLAEKVKAWISEGKVRAGTADGAPAASAKVRGAGTVE